MTAEQERQIAAVVEETGMSPEEAAEVVRVIADVWSSGDYREVMGSQLSGNDSEDARVIEGYIELAEKWGDAMVTFRGMNLDDATYGDLTTEGHLFEPRMLQSWTTDGGIALEFSQFWKGGHPVILKCDTQNNGVGVKHMSKMPEENEVLAGKQSRYRVKNVIEDYNGLGVTVIELEEI